MKIRVAAVGLAVALVSHVSMAEDNAKVAKAVAERYVGTLGCDSKIGPRNIALVADPKADPADNLDSYYVTVVDSDLQCAGGSGTSAGHIVVVGKAQLRVAVDTGLQAADLRVRPELSEPNVVTIGAPRAITSLYMKDGQLQATGLEYGDKDSNCCPSLKTIYKVQLIRKEMQIGKDDRRPANTWVFTKIKNYQ